eukprot:CAMPEP_0178967376 /NCGR_PEP_ID=MMETSP0789-20121207/17551_1 /TAXON_ID=3005 /ORGANISM="Rhizosolenia setigera, Strain CCMP 1694" /LENGTH=153 /DNA_ID=CAMNT_0020652961 /DNA_START=250 /DNA_END=711 /DNA_ORIENTATION=-
MKVSLKSSSFVLFLLLTIELVSSFSLNPTKGCGTNVHDTKININEPMLTTTVDDITAYNDDYQHGGRRAFLIIASLGPAVATVAFNPSPSYADGFGSDDDVDESFDHPSAEELERQRIAHNASIVKRQKEREAANAKKQAEKQEAKKAQASQE